MVPCCVSQILIARLVPHSYSRMTVNTQLVCRLIVLAVGIGSVVGCGSGKSDSTPRKSASERDSVEDRRPVDFVAQARRLFQLGDLESAAALAHKALVQNPDSADAKLIAAELEAARGNHQTAVELASSIDLRSRLGLRAAELRFQQLIELDRLSAAADVILAALESVPDRDTRAITWRRQAWRLLCRTGRRQEASRQAIVLCRAGQATGSIAASDRALPRRPGDPGGTSLPCPPQ
jgi:tetratricopeptide (TPR) repeat protein